MPFTIDRREEEAMIGAFTHDKVMAVLKDAALAGGMAGRTLRYRDTRIPWSERLTRLEAVIRDYVEKHR